MSDIKKAPEGAKANSVAPNNNTNYNANALDCQVETLIRNATPNRPITRRELARRVQVDDRTVRQAIERLRHSGHRIVASNEGGYYYAENAEQYKAFRASIISRIVKESAMLKAMDGVAEGQVDMQW